MGTRSITQVLDHGDRVIVSMYRQFDGYPSGHGEELMQFIQSGKVVNGLGEGTKVFNGIEDFAAQMVAHFKTEPGGFYLHAPSTREELAEDIFIEYVYTVKWATEDPHAFDPKGVFYVEVDNIRGKTFFGGQPKVFLDLLESGDLQKMEDEGYEEES